MAAFAPGNNDTPVITAKTGKVEVRMIVEISGTRDGKDWPKRGETIKLPALEAAILVANHQALPADDAETAVALGVETAVPSGNRPLSAGLATKPASRTEETVDNPARDQAEINAQAAADTAKVMTTATGPDAPAAPAKAAAKGGK